MKKRILILSLMISSCILLTGCCLNHEWEEASCSAPKTCVKCGETEGEPLEHTWVEATCAKAKHCEVCDATEGEPLEHTWTEATYQTAKTCKICGATEGTPLQADYEAHNLTINCELDKEYDYVTCCYSDTSKTTIGKAVFSDYETFESDDTHEAKEGYEWKKITITASFSDENFTSYGYKAQAVLDDYYTTEPLVDDSTEFYTVNFNGVEYPECRQEANVEEFTEGSTKISKFYFYFLVPIGYDGAVVGLYNAASNWEVGHYFYEIADENTLLFRLN